jgi:hypothetical protein
MYLVSLIQEVDSHERQCVCVKLMIEMEAYTSEIKRDEYRHIEIDKDTNHPVILPTGEHDIIHADIPVKDSGTIVKSMVTYEKVLMATWKAMIR